MKRALAMVIGMALLGSACAARQDTSSRCPGYERMHCLTPVQCTFDQARGCEVCRCEDTPYVPVAR